MEWYQVAETGEFITALANAIAWPVAIVLILASFRDPLEKVLNKVFLIKYGGAEFHFDKDLNEAKESLDRARNTGELQATLDTGFPSGAPRKDPYENLMRVAEFSPASAIVGGWVEIETELQELARRHNVTGADRLYASRIVRELTRRAILKPHLIKTLEVMLRIRNESAHGGQVTETSV